MYPVQSLPRGQENRFSRDQGDTKTVPVPWTSYLSVHGGLCEPRAAVYVCSVGAPGKTGGEHPVLTGPDTMSLTPPRVSHRLECWSEDLAGIWRSLPASFLTFTRRSLASFSSQRG